MGRESYPTSLVALLVRIDAVMALKLSCLNVVERRSSELFVMELRVMLRALNESIEAMSLFLKPSGWWSAALIA